MPTPIQSNLDLGGVAKITNSLNPTSAQDLTTKAYVDTAARLVNIQYLTTGTSYIPTTGTTKIEAQLIGGGGGGGAITAAITAAAGGGAGAECFTGLITLPGTASFVMAIGAAGAGGIAGANPGSAGGNTTLAIGATTYTANGGSGGTGSGTGANSVTGGAGGTATNGAVNKPGSSGGFGFSTGTGSASVSGDGGSSSLGAGGRGLANSVGNSPGLAGTGFGAGGSGARATTAVTNAGGAGSAGIIVIREYI